MTVRMLPSRYLEPRPSRVKKGSSRVDHLSAPLKGLSLSAKLTVTDPLLAPILDNWVVEEDRISVRPGTAKIADMGDGLQIYSLIPFYGTSPKMLAASGGKLRNALDAAPVASGFTSDIWSWTHFSNLGEDDYTIIVNGNDGVWSWNGLDVPVKEAVTAPVASTWIVPDEMRIVVAHLNRLWFADKKNLALFYLPLQQKSGELGYIPMNAIFRRGGTIRALYTWTLEGGESLNDQLVIFTSNGECAIFSGTDPATDFELTGVFRFDSPMSDRCVINSGGELYVLVSTGLVPMTTMLRAEEEQLGKAERDVVSLFTEVSIPYRDSFGWETILDHHSGRIICNQPIPDQQRQLVRMMPKSIWTSWSSLKATTWQWINSQLYFATKNGEVFHMDPSYFSDNGSAITADVQSAWSLFRTPAVKHFKMVLPYLSTDGEPHPYIEIKVDYDESPPTNLPDLSSAFFTGSSWDVAEWDEAEWAGGMRRWNNWTGAAAMGRVGAVRMTVSVLNCRLQCSGWDVLHEPGSIFG